MIDHRFHNGADEVKKINYEANKVFYDPDKPRIKDILWKHYGWIEKTYEEGRLRDAILDMFKEPFCARHSILAMMPMTARIGTTGSGYSGIAIPGSVHPAA